MVRYKVLEAIGEGSFGKVFKGECRDTKQVVALKFIPKHLKGGNEVGNLKRECEIQRGLFHPNIVRMLDSFETEREVVAVSEYVPFQLCSLLQANGCLPEVVVCRIACNLVSALYYLHSHRIVHRDIKPQNILLTDLSPNGVAKLCDFGFSKKMEINTYVLESIKGTPLYMAPELIEQQPYDQKADVWSLGCILYELLTGKPPFCTDSIVHLIEMVRTKPILWPIGCPVHCLSFLQGLLQKDQDRRLEWPDILQHSWVSKGIVIMPHNPRIATLTSPLTLSQQQVKEQQKQQLALRNMGQPNLLPKVIARKILSDARAAQELEAAKRERALDTLPTEHLVRPSPVDNLVANKICNSLEKMSLSNGAKEATQGTREDVKSPQMWPASNGRRVSQVDVTAGVGAAPKTGRKTDKNDYLFAPALAETRKNSASSYVGHSYEGTKRNSKLSAFGTEEGGQIIAGINTEPSSDNTVTNCTKSQDTGGCGFDDTDMQEDEWIHFLDHTIADVLGGNFDVYTQTGELGMFVAPLRNKSCPLAVMEKISALFMLPFVLKPDEGLVSKICASYLQHKVVCNFIFACKHVYKKLYSDGAFELDKDQVSALNQMLLVVCHLIHLLNKLSSSFLGQLCEGICVLECHVILGLILLCQNSSSQLLASVLAILTQMLRCEEPVNGVDLTNVVLMVIASAVTRAGSPQAPACTAGVSLTSVDQRTLESSLRFIMMALLTHSAYLVRSRTSSMLGHLTSRRPSLVNAALAGQHKLLCDLINLENDPSREVCRAASFALSRLQQHTSLLKNSVT